MRYLMRTWADIRKKAERVKAPALVHRDLDLVQRILRDQLSDEFTAIRVDNEIEYARIVEFVNASSQTCKSRKAVHRTSRSSKSSACRRDRQSGRPRVWLKSGGYIVINQTEALVAIDVNTGKFVGKSDRLEDTITRTNLEAAKEIVRQVRLRDLGGIIVVDFIDMEERKNRQKVMQALAAGAVARPRAVEDSFDQRFRTGGDHAQASQAIARAHSVHAVSVLPGGGDGEVGADDVLRDPRASEGDVASSWRGKRRDAEGLPARSGVSAHD